MQRIASAFFVSLTGNSVMYTPTDRGTYRLHETQHSS